MDRSHYRGVEPSPVGPTGREPPRPLTTYETGIADVINELNNRLNAILGLAALGERAAETEDDALGQVGLEARRAAALVRDLTYLVRPSRAGEGAVHLGAAIDALRRRRGSELAELGIEVAADLAPGLALIMGPPEDLEMLLGRLLAFAEARLRDAPPPRRVQLHARQIGASVLLTQTDSGPALPPSHAEHELHYFRPADPEFLGHVELALAQRVAETCSAGVRLEAGPDGRAELHVTLIPSTLLASPGGRPPATPRRGTRVLIVEDDEANRHALRRLLEREGYVVGAAQDGRDALRLLARERPDAVILDLQMPRMDGRETWERLRSRWPDLAGRVVFVTGDDTRAGSATFLQTTGQPIVRKPYELPELLSALATVVRAG